MTRRLCLGACRRAQPEEPKTFLLQLARQEVTTSGPSSFLPPVAFSSSSSSAVPSLPNHKQGSQGWLKLHSRSYLSLFLTATALKMHNSEAPLVEGVGVESAALAYSPVVQEGWGSHWQPLAATAVCSDDDAYTPGLLWWNSRDSGGLKGGGHFVL